MRGSLHFDPQIMYRIPSYISRKKTCLSVFVSDSQPAPVNLRGIMSAGRKTPSIYTAKDLNIDTADLSPKLIIEEISVPDSDKKCEMISGDNNIEIGRKLALKLRESRIF